MSYLHVYNVWYRVKWMHWRNTGTVNLDVWDTGTNNERGNANGKDILWYRKYKSKNALGGGCLKQGM